MNHLDGIERRSVVRVIPNVMPRSVARVPFVELAEGRLAGVVSSGSDISRVYVSSIAAGDHGFTCSTNNNRPCGGLRGSMCKHLEALVVEAVAQYGVARVARYLGVPGSSELSGADDLLAGLRGTQDRQPAAAVFSRFLRHLAYLELPPTGEPVAELQWFPAGEARA